MIKYAIVVAALALGVVLLTPEPPLQSFVYFGAEWCAPCKRMKSETLADKSVHSYLQEKFSERQAVLDIDVVPKLAARFEVKSVPTYLILEEGKEIKRGVGFRGPAEFLKWLK